MLPDDLAQDKGRCGWAQMSGIDRGRAAWRRKVVEVNVSDRLAQVANKMYFQRFWKYEHNFNNIDMATL